MPEPTAAPTTETIQQALTEVKTNTGEFPGEFKLGDGTVVKAANWEEAFNKVAEMKVNTAAAVRDREEQIRQLKEQPPATTTAAPPTNANGFDQKAYWELMNADPLAAQNYLDAFRFGVDNPAHVPQLFNEMRNVSVHSADTMELNTFMQRNPDYPGTEEAANLLIEQLAARNAPLTADALEYEYLKAVRDGKIEPLGEEIQRPFAPPNLGTGASLSRNDQNLLEQIAQVPDDKLDEFYRKAGLLK
jgi:hypothetical protein